MQINLIFFYQNLVEVEPEIQSLDYVKVYPKKNIKFR